MKKKDWDKLLDKVTAAKTDQLFLSRLATWIFELSGNVNATQRLNVLGIRAGTKSGG